MGTLTHAAARLAAGTAIDRALKKIDNKDRQTELLKLVDLMQTYMDGEKLDVDFDKIRGLLADSDSALNH